MLRRDTEYVLTWNPQTYAWMARPVRLDGGKVVRAGVGFVEVNVSPSDGALVGTERGE